MARRPSTRRIVNLESLESRNLLSGGVAPTAETQYMLEVVNLVRTNPAAAAQRLHDRVTPATKDTLDYYGLNLDQVTSDLASSAVRQPLAWNDALASAANGQSQDMATKGFQSHQGSDGSWPDARMERAGYVNRAKSAENAFAYAESVDQAMQAFTYDWGVPDHGHRRNLTEPGASPDSTFKEVGLGIVNSSKPGFAKVITQDFGLRNDSPSYLLGVAYSDNDHDRFYTPGEGRGGVEVDVTNDNGQTQATWSGAAGGYQIPLTPGRYKVTAKLDGRQIRTQEVNVGSQNVKLDFVLSDPWTPVESTPDPNNDSKPATTPTPPQAQVVTAPVTVSIPTRTTPDPVKIDTTPSESRGTEVVMFSDDFFDDIFGDIPMS